MKYTKQICFSSPFSFRFDGQTVFYSRLGFPKQSLLMELIFVCQISQVVFVNGGRSSFVLQPCDMKLELQSNVAILYGSLEDIQLGGGLTLASFVRGSEGCSLQLVRKELLTVATVESQLLSAYQMKAQMTGKLKWLLLEQGTKRATGASRAGWYFKSASASRLTTMRHVLLQ